MSYFLTTAWICTRIKCHEKKVVLPIYHQHFFHILLGFGGGGRVKNDMHGIGLQNGNFLKVQQYAFDLHI